MLRKRFQLLMDIPCREQLLSFLLLDCAAIQGLEKPRLLHNQMIIILALELQVESTNGWIDY